MNSKNVTSESSSLSSVSSSGLVSPPEFVSSSGMVSSSSSSGLVSGGSGVGGASIVTVNVTAFE